ncbi:hypothetical protein Ccar_01640 [Clostridium carboxidivorans P7]|uniref:DUF3298 domain-containing protein n=1 Tax=Clostridium carboxidivorans P7 TaxID=536227 RepID=C6PQ65_9CLOT|nr:DUF3298 and DUF4163 domain-containing protein [Clostridium carboxidivorans]AKN29617.1 hypothetical protein Ccar_01640 [Clostridium carboxidivorans P7]EET88670.1 conserved hypothetical protein [Clostridium carboxidivorans P7]EFG89458.1 hypothetical protein CLCAR_0615 [Clostridium carboxidivorans P7]
MYNLYPFYCPFTNCMRISNNIAIDSQQINSTEKYIKKDLKIPVLKGMKNKNIENQINNSIKSDIMEFKQQMEESANEYGMQAEKVGKKFIPFIISTNYSITYNKNNIASITIFYYEFINGKHSYIKTSYNFNLNSGKSLSLKDLFKQGVSYKQIINKEIKKYLIQNKELYIPGTVTNFKGISDDQPFYLDNENIVIYLGFNEIAPNISEIPIIKIPFSTLKNYIKPIFLN